MAGFKKEHGLSSLLIRHLPREFSDHDKLDFLQYYGAVSVNSVCRGEKKNEIVFATFPSPSVAKAALLRLHQLEVLGCHLTVEYARSSSTSSVTAGTCTQENRVEILPDVDKSRRLQDQFMRRLVAWSSKLNLSQPPPSHLRYQYPPPTPATLSNISKALTMYPRLYTQLLHLMNRMNLPPPFQDAYGVKITHNQTTQTDLVLVQKSSSESEMESEEEQLSNPSFTQPAKRVLPRRKTKPLKRPRFIKPMASIEPSSLPSVSLKPEEVFEIADTEVHPKKIELRLAVSLPVEKEKDTSVKLGVSESEGFGVLHPSTKLNDNNNETREPNDVGDSCSFITSKQLASNRIPQKDLQHLPLFKNYSPGVPSCRLYVKNVSKSAVARDLHFIYRHFLQSDQNETEGATPNMFDIRLMTEGRMKGQAFITFPSVKQAQQALIETNGYIIKDKPLVVQFARSAPAPVGSITSV